MSRTRAPARHALAVAFGSVLALAAAVVFVARPPLFDALRAPEQRALLFGACTLLALLSACAGWLGVRAQRLQRGIRGRLRFSLLGYGTSVFTAAGAAGLLLMARVGDKLPAGSPVSLEDALWLLPVAYRNTLVALAVALAVAATVTLGVLVGAWFLLSLRARRSVFLLFDLCVLIAFVWYSYRYELAPLRLTPDAVTGASLRLLATLLLSIRLFVRALPWLLHAIELVDFRALIAARHLRAKKSGFLAAISLLSILAVSVSSCALTTTLSVMGGFRQDLKRKILGNNAHIVIDRAGGKLADYDALAGRVRAVDGVRGVSPYLAGEVMISSASNLAGAVLRGIDLAHIGEVSELPRTLRIGSLDYLASPEKLSNLPSSQLGLNLAPNVANLDSEEQAKPGKPGRLSEELDKALRAPQGPKTATPASAVLPGIVVGQELARSLRLYLGDEVNVVTPLGELGPTGPMPKSRPFRVAGIFYSGMYEYDMKFAYVTLPVAQRFLGAASTASGVEITVREPERAQEIARSISDALPRELVHEGAGEASAASGALRVRPWQELNKNLFGALALEKLAMFIALGIAILVASFCIVGTLTLMVQEKGREVAVLKAMGAGDRAIVAIFVLEGTLIGVLGSLLGLGFGYAVCFAAEHFGVRLNPEVYYIDKLPVHIDPSEFFTVAIAATLVSLLVTIYPAKIASRLRPVDALRYE